MEESELLAEARRRYPVGAIFDSCGGNNNLKILEGTTFRMSHDEKGWVQVVGCKGNGHVYSPEGSNTSGNRANGWVVVKNPEGLIFPTTINNSYQIF